MNYIEVSGMCINLDHVAYIQKEDHPQLGQVVTLHFATPDLSPVRVSEDHYDRLRERVTGAGAK